MEQTFNHTPEAIAAREGSTWSLDDEAENREWSGIGVGPVGQHRDSDELGRSNYEVIMKDMSERFPDTFADVRLGHWAVGWVEQMIYDPGHKETADAVEEWMKALESYPVADDDHYSNLEYEEFCEYVEGLRMSYTDEHGLDWEVPEDGQGKLIEWIREEYQASRADDLPHDADLEKAAYEAGILQPEPDEIKKTLNYYQGVIHEARVRAQDIWRGVGTSLELAKYLEDHDNDS